VPVVSDTSPLSYLILIEEVEVLGRLYGEIYVPPAVMGELSHPDGPEATRRWAQDLPAWLQVKEPPEAGGLDPRPEPREKLRSLDRGERQAILLAEEEGALPLIDERDGRSVARALGLSITGTIGVLDEAASEGLVDPRGAADRLRETSFRASEELYRWLIERHS